MICNNRTADFAIKEVFLQRQSAYAMTSEPITNEQLMILFEAARWSTSSYNNQPTRFIYAHRDTPAWETLFDLMVPANQTWAKNAAVLVVVISKRTMADNSPSITNSFEAGAAWMSLCLQATMNGLSAHGMSGFDYEKTCKNLNIPDGFKVEIMCAIGKQATQEVDQKFLDRDAKHTARKKLNEIATEGNFHFNE